MTAFYSEHDPDVAVRDIAPDDRFGKLVVVSLHPGAKRKHPLAGCLCDCGNRRFVRQTLLRRLRVDCCAACSMRRGWDGRERADGTERAFLRLFDTYQNGAKRRGLVFSLDKDRCRILFSGDCHYCGCPPTRVVKAKSGDGRALLNGIDRIDNGRGYQEDNVVSCCEQCNFAKRDMALSDFMAWIDRIASYRRGGP